LGIFDTLLVCILVSILIGTVIPYYQQLAREAKETALQTGLANIRKGIDLYRVLQGRLPADLKSLVHARYIIPAREDTFFSGEYLRSQATDSTGNLVDPFGNQYRYNPLKGTVSSGTEGYETW
jgi:type II secretory pathway pseudopilin PulG